MTDISWMRPKLAELCGLRYVQCPHGSIDPYLTATGNETIMWHNWRPDEDVAQAVRCLSALHPDAFRRIDYQGTLWTVRIWPVQERNASGGGQDKSLPSAICLAIAAALGWTDTNSGTETECE